MKATNLQVKKFCLSIILLMTFFIYNASNASALDDVTVRLLNNRELIAGNYTAFCQDSDGFIWVGTDTGLIRFDGNHGDLYRNDESDPASISDNKIVSLFSDSQGATWIGTVNGLNRYDSETDTFQLVELPGMQLNGYITDIVELKDGRILFLVGGIGFYTLDTKGNKGKSDKLTAQRFKFGFHDDNEINRVIGMGSQGIIFTTRSGDVCKWKPGATTEPITKLTANVSHIYPESQSSLILGTQYEVFRLNLNSGAITRLKTAGGEAIKITDIRCLNGISYISTAGSGVWEAEEESNNVIRSKHLHSSTADLSLMKVGSIFIDKAGNLWMGCNHKGVAIAPSSEGPFANKSLIQILKDTNGAEVLCIKAIDDKIVLGFNTGDIAILHPDGAVRKVTVSHGNPVTAISNWQNDQLLVGVARDGIWTVDMRSLALSRLVKPAGTYPGVVLSVGKGGELIAAFGELGVMRYNPATGSEKWFYPVGGSNLLSCFYYAGASTTSDGRIWIGGYSGIACYDPASDGLLPIDQTPFIKGVVNDVCDATDGIMIATDRGLILYSLQKGVVRKYTVADGLPDNDVRTLESDSNGGIWIGTMKGLAYLKDTTSGIQTYGSSNGVGRTSYIFSDRLQGSGRFVVGNYENLTLFHPDSVKQTSFGVDVKITGMYLNGKRLTAKSHTGVPVIVEGTMAHPEALKLSHKDNALVIRLATLDFRDASDLHYEWQFEGEGDVWHSTTPGLSHIYLPPLESGHHTLRIKGWENNVASEVTELRLDVKTPWYLSDMAYTSYVIIALLIAGLVYKVVKNKREEELYEARIRYFMDISHELRSPVTLMLSPVETLLKQEHSPETTSQLLTVRRNAQRVLNLVDQLLDLRKIEKGKMKLMFTAVDIKGFVKELVEMFRPMAEEKGLSLSFVCDLKDLWGAADRNNLDKILVNLISNAIKYTPKGGDVSVSLSKETEATGADEYTITVTDSGIGLDNKMISHLFERFYRNEEHHHGNPSGFGIGLDLCMRLVELHKGKITAKNREDGIKGSIFSVTLPLNPVIPGSEKSEDEPKHRRLPDVVSGSTKRHDTGKSSRRCRILVVDDDDELREYIKHSLGASYKVTAMPDAEAAIKELGERIPDLIVTDIRMKGLDGLELLRRVKSNMATQHIPVIIFSSASGSDERTKGWKIGADGYLAKPFTIEELESMISGLLTTRSKLKGKFSGLQKSADRIEAPKVKGVDEDLMERINRYINDNLSETTMNVDGLSEYVGLSRSQLHRRMKDIIGVAPSDYIRNVKLRKACEMLSHGDVDIAQVAYSLGFNAQSHFSTLFKRYTGMTPSEYRTLAKEGKISGETDINENDTIT